MSSPFVRRKIMCPICEKESFQYSLMPNQFSVEEKEDDQHPTKLKWYNPDFQDVKPQYYVLFHCPICMFTDFEENFTKPQSILNFQSLRGNYIKPNPTKSKILQFFKSTISYDNMNFRVALLAHINAIYIYELETREQYKDIKKLARLYHRTAWLFREQQPQEDSTSDSAMKKEIQNNLDTLSASFAEFNRKFNPLLDNLKRRVIDLGIKFDDPNNPYIKDISEFNSLSEQIQKTITKLRITSSKDKALIQNVKTASADDNYEEELGKLTDCWPTIPMNERDCLNRAIDNYEKQYQKISSNDSLNQQIGIMNVLTELCLRVNNYKKAFEYLSSLYQFCATNRQNLFSQQRQSSSSIVESQINKLGEVMVTLSDRRKLIEEKQEEFYFPQIQKFIEDNGSMSWDEIKDTLIKRDIPEDVLDKFNATDDDSYENESAGEDSSGKKKRWGLF